MFMPTLDKVGFSGHKNNDFFCQNIPRRGFVIIQKNAQQNSAL